MSTAQVRNDLIRCEAVIFRTIKAGRDFWLALVEIHDRELWKAAKTPYTSWSNYLATRWPALNVAFARRKVKGARAHLLLPGGEELSDRALSALAGEPEEVQLATLELAKKMFGDAPTEEQIRAALAALPPKLQVERTRARESRNDRRIKEDGEAARRKQAERLVNRLVKISDGFPETGAVAEALFTAGLRALLAVNDPEIFLPLQKVAERPPVRWLKLAHAA